MKFKHLPFLLSVVLALSSFHTSEAAPYGRIGEKYALLGGPNGALGPSIGNEADAPYGGRFHLFRDGLIYWHPEIGEAFAVWGAISSKWWKQGRVEFGYPITDEMTTPDGRGRYNHFRALHLPGKPEASIYWTPQTGANAIYGLIREAWARQGWERGSLGYPTSDEFQDGSFRRSNFERGYILWSAATGIKIVNSGTSIPTAPQSFGAHLVTGIDLALNGRPFAGNATFLSENVVCSSQNLAELSAWLKQKILSTVNPRLSQFGVQVRPDAQLVLHCSFRAQVVRACDTQVSLRAVLPRGLFKFWIDMPGEDPGFSIDFDLETSSAITIPRNSRSPFGIGKSQVKVSNLKLDSQNTTADVLLAAAKFAAMVHEFFTGYDIERVLTQDRAFALAGIQKTLVELNPNFDQIPPQYRIEACMTEGNILRLNGTGAASTEPIVR